jgi:hypothetical protein
LDPIGLPLLLLVALRVLAEHDPGEDLARRLARLRGRLYDFGFGDDHPPRLAAGAVLSDPVADQLAAGTSTNAQPEPVSSPSK